MTRYWAAVIGSPVRRSLSPIIFRHLRRKMGRRLNYVAVTVEPVRLHAALESAKSRPWVGWNVTLPLKVSIVPFLDSLDASAQEVGAVNVVRFLDKGVIGYNTDSEGFLAPLRRMGWPIQGRRVVVFGAGGAARAVCSGLRRNKTGEIVVFSRTEAHIEPLVKDFGVLPGSLDLGHMLEAVSQADLVVNATPLGMDGWTSPLCGAMRWKKGALAYDLVYRPLETPFLRQAREEGAQTLGGLAMLVAQAAATWRIWFGEEVPQDVSMSIEDHLRRAFT